MMAATPRSWSTPHAAATSPNARCRVRCGNIAVSLASVAAAMSAAVPRYRSEIIFGLPSTRPISRRYQQVFPPNLFGYKLAMIRSYTMMKTGSTTGTVCHQGKRIKPDHGPTPEDHDPRKLPLEVVGRSLAPDLARVHSCAAHPGIADQRRPDGRPGARPPARRSLPAVGMRHRHARSRGSRWAAAVRPLPIIGSRGCLATARLGAIAPLVDLAHPILYRCLPLLLGRSDVLDQAPGVEAQLLGHADRLVGQSAPSLRLRPALLLTWLVRFRHPVLNRSSARRATSLYVSSRLQNALVGFRLFLNNPSWRAARVGRIEQRLVDAGQTIAQLAI